MARLALLIDYASGTVGFDGRIETPEVGVPNLEDWGLSYTRNPWRAENDTAWNVHGEIPGAVLTTPVEADFIHLAIGPLRLLPTDELTLIIPFAIIGYSQITPPPDNLSDLTSGLWASSDLSAGLLGLKYRGGGGRELRIDIPFTPVNKQTELQITPLIGEMLRGRTDSFRLTGRVTYQGLQDFAEFRQHCQTDPGSPNYRYRDADLLFGIDAPPVLSAGLLSPLYSQKLTYSLVRVDLEQCTFASGQGVVEATFTGRVFSRLLVEGGLSDEWLNAGTQEINREIVTARGDRVFELQLGDINLAPGDLLTVSLPDAGIWDVAPPPTSYSLRPGSEPVISYLGPGVFGLRLVYSPSASMVLSQAPSVLRAVSQPLEEWLRTHLRFEQNAIPWGVSALAASLLVLAGRGQSGRAKRLTRALGWLILGLTLFYGVRGAYGLLLLAPLVLVAGARPRRLNPRNVGGVVAVLVGVPLVALLDLRSERLFAVLTTIELETTPLTPVLLGGLGLGMAVLLAISSATDESKTGAWSMPAAIILLTLATYDVIQKSLWSAALLGASLLFLWRKEITRDSSSLLTQSMDRLKQAWQGRVIPLGLVLMIGLGFQQGLSSTSAVIGRSLGIWSTVLSPILLLVSLAHGLIAISLLFVYLYPILPFKPGYLKAFAFSLLLLLIYLVGVAGDHRLILTLEKLAIGRLVYYLSLPLLIGLYFDVIDSMKKEEQRLAAEGVKGEPLTFGKAIPIYFGNLKGILATLGKLAAILAPGIYSALAGNPVVITYFDLLDAMFALTRT